MYSDALSKNFAHTTYSLVTNNRRGIAVAKLLEGHSSRRRFTNRVPVGVVKSLVVRLERASIAAAAGECHVTVVKESANHVAGVVVGQHEDETSARVGPEVDVQSSPVVNIGIAFNSATVRVLLSAAEVSVAITTTNLQKQQQLLLLLLLRHWLPVRQRIEFKLAVLVYKAMNGLSAQYLADDCQLITSTAGRRRLRSSNVATCEVPRTRTSLGDHSFTIAGLRL